MVLTSPFLSLNNADIIARASKLGVSLGQSLSQVIGSINRLKDTENSRSITFLSNNLEKIDGGEHHSLVMRKASNLCDETDTGLEDDAEDYLDSFVKPAKITRKRAAKNGIGLTVKRRSARIETLRKVAK